MLHFLKKIFKSILKALSCSVFRKQNNYIDTISFFDTVSHGKGYYLAAPVMALYLWKELLC